MGRGVMGVASSEETAAVAAAAVQAWRGRGQGVVGCGRGHGPQQEARLEGQQGAALRRVLPWGLWRN